MDAEEDLLDGDGGLPGFLFVEDRQTDGAGGVDVRVEKRRGEFAWSRVSQDGSSYSAFCCWVCVHFGGFVGYSAMIVSAIVHSEVCAHDLTIGELHFKLEKSALPDSLVSSRDHALPALEVESALRVLGRLCDEAERVILAPCFPVAIE